MTKEDIERCKKLQNRAAICWKYCNLYPSVFKLVHPIVSMLYAEDRRIRGVE